MSPYPNLTSRPSTRGRPMRMLALAGAAALLVTGCSTGSVVDDEDNQVAEYFEALNVGNPVDMYAAEGSPAEASGAYAALTRQAEQAHDPDDNEMTTTIEAVEGGYDLILPDQEVSGETFGPDGVESTGAAEPYSPELVEYRDIETDDDGLVSSYTIDGTPVGDSLWASEAVEGHGIDLGPVYAAANPNGVFVVMEVTNLSGETAPFNGILLTQDDNENEHLSDPGWSLYPLDGVEAGDATVVSFGNPMMEPPIKGEPIDFLIEMWIEDDTVVLMADTVLEPFDS